MTKELSTKGDVFWLGYVLFDMPKTLSSPDLSLTSQFVEIRFSRSIYDKQFKCPSSLDYQFALGLLLEKLGAFRFFYCSLFLPVS
jgi:hypothetical protein